MHRLAELGAWGVTFHDDDVVPFQMSAAERELGLKRLRSALDETGMVVPMLRNRPMLGAALGAAAVALAAHALPYKLGLMLAALAGVVIGVLLEEFA